MKCAIILLALPSLLNAVKVETQENTSLPSLFDEFSSSNYIQERDLNCSKTCFNCYMRFCQIYHFLNTVRTKNRDIVTLSRIGKSYRGRNIYCLKISKNKNNKKGIVIDANMGAREWITSATAIWIINKMVVDRGSILDDIDWYIIPMVNPDGYEFTHTENRQWVKNRQPDSGPPCIGVNLDRNFPYKWGEHGASSDACSETYRGPSAESAPETKVVANFLRSLRAENILSLGYNLAAYVSFQAYRELWLYPWGYTHYAVSDHKEQNDLANKVVEAIRKVNGIRYTAGSAANTMYAMSGCSIDYAKSIGIKYPAAVFLRDTGMYEYELPANQIEANAKEIYAGLEVVAAKVRSEPNSILNVGKDTPVINAEVDLK